MAKRRIAVVTFLICFCFFLMTCFSQAASTTNASEPILLEKECNLSLSYTSSDTAFSDVSVKLYKIADVSVDFQYTLTSHFSSTGLILNGVQSVGEWNVIRSTLEAYIIAESINSDIAATTDSKGTVSFANLTPGLYLTEAVTVNNNDITYFFDSALVSLPNLDENGLWQYKVSVASKSEVLPPIEPDEETQLKVLKLWKDDQNKTNRPESVDVEIFKDGTSYKNIVLSEENNWSFSWSVKDDGANWTVVERNVPTGYTMTVEERESSFVLTNTFVPNDPNVPPNSPQTGDTSNVMLYIVVLIVSGMILVILGFVGKRNTNEKD